MVMVQRGFAMFLFIDSTMAGTNSMVITFEGFFTLRPPGSDASP